MGQRRKNYFFQVGNRKIGISGAPGWYGDNDVKAAIGSQLVDEGDIDSRGSVDYGKSNRNLLVRLTATLKGQGPLGAGNAAQNDKSVQRSFYCDPSHVEEAMETLPGKTVDLGAGIGSYKITNVRRPWRITRQ